MKLSGRSRVGSLVTAAAVMLAGCDGAAQTPPAGEVTADAVPPPPKPLAPELAEHFRLIEQRQTGAARVRLNKHLKLHPDDGQAEFLFGLSYHREKRYARAVPWFERAREHEPGYDATHYFHAWALYYLGEPDASRRAFERHLELRPDEADSHFGIGLIELDADRLEEAQRRFDTAVDLLAGTEGKPLSKALARRADVHIRRGDYERAKGDLLRATALYPDHYEAYYKLYRVLFRLGEREAAEEAKSGFLASRERLYPGTSFPE